MKTDSRLFTLATGYALSVALSLALFVLSDRNPAMAGPETIPTLEEARVQAQAQEAADAPPEAQVSNTDLPGITAPVMAEM